jgi:hypothetical protein
MKFNSTTYWIALMMLALYSVYILSALGIVGLLLSMSFGLIAASFLDDFELVTVTVVLLGLGYVIMTRWMGSRPIVKCNAGKKEGFSDGSPKEITTLMDTMEQQKYGKDRRVTPMSWASLDPTGVLSKGVEGFEDISKPSETEKKEGAPAESAPAEAKTVDKKPVDELQKKVEEATTAPKTNGQSPPAKQADGFRANQAGLFKLGELPSESAEGPHIDAGTTLMKAMSALNPEQITSMTQDTRSLIETQQNLMGMLKNMQPILQDGRKLLDSFSGIFGSDMSPQKGFKLGGMSA